MLLTAWTLTLHTMYHSHIVTNICNTNVHCVKKAYPLIFDNFGICGLIFKIVLLIDSYENSLYTPQIFPPHLQYVYTTLWKLKIQKMLPNFQVFN